MTARVRPAALAVIAAILNVVAAPAASAAEMRLSPPKADWALRFDAPAGLVGKGELSEDHYEWTGAAGTTRVSYRIEPLPCDDLESATAVADCFNATFKRTVTGADVASLRVFKRSMDGIVAHWSALPVHEGDRSAFSAEALIVTRYGLWARLVVRAPAATPAEMHRLMDMAASAAIVDGSEPPAAVQPLAPIEPVAARLDVPGRGWGIRFESPPFDKHDEHVVADSYRVDGDQGRFMFSLYVGQRPPRCAGGIEGAARIEACFRSFSPSLDVVPRSLQVTKLRDDAVLANYEVEFGDGATYMHYTVARVLFSHGGQWGDLNASSVQQSPADVDALRRIGETFDIVDVPAAH